MYYDDNARKWVDDGKEQKASRQDLLDRVAKSKNTRFPIKVFLVEEVKANYMPYDVFLFDSLAKVDGQNQETWISI